MTYFERALKAIPQIEERQLNEAMADILTMVEERLKEKKNQYIQWGSSERFNADDGVGYWGTGKRDMAKTACNVLGFILAEERNEGGYAWLSVPKTFGEETVAQRIIRQHNTDVEIAIRRQQDQARTKVEEIFRQVDEAKENVSVERDGSKVYYTVKTEIQEDRIYRRSLIKLLEEDKFKDIGMSDNTVSFSLELPKEG